MQIEWGTQLGGVFFAQFEAPKGNTLATRSKAAPSAPSGAPRWTYALGSIVGAAGLVWGVVSYFIPKPSEPTKVPPAASAPSPTVNVSGSGSVGVGIMSGGAISLGAQTPTPASAPALGKP